jgi:hypothetical protein
MPKWNKPRSTASSIKIKRAPREALQGHAGHRVHDRARQAVHAPDAHGQAQRPPRRSASRCDMVKEKLIDEKTAILRIPAGDLTQLLLPSFDPKAKKTADRADQRASRPRPARPPASSRSPRRRPSSAPAPARRCILVRKETSPEDVEGMHSRGGHPDVAPAAHQPRGGRRPRLGQVLRRRRGRAPDRREEGHASRSRPDLRGATTSSRSTARPAR